MRGLFFTIHCRSGSEITEILFKEWYFLRRQERSWFLGLFRIESGEVNLF